MAFDKEKPAGNQKVRLGDDDIRANNAALETAIGQDHDFATGAGQTGEHKQIKLYAPIATPGNLANKGFVYIKDVGGKVELHFLDEDGNETQLTSAGSPPNLLKGLLCRAEFVYKDADEIYINSGAYELNGKHVWWDSQLTKQLVGAAADTWYYLYLDDSEIAGSGLIDTTKFIFSDTAPAKSHAKHGQYNGNDKCVFAVLTDGAGNIVEFFQNGNYVGYATGIYDQASTPLDADFSDEITLTVPSFVRRAEFHFRWDYIDGSSSLWWRTEGQASAGGHRVASVAGDTGYDSNTVPVTCSSNLKIDVKEDAGTNNTITGYTEGWYLPDDV